MTAEVLFTGYPIEIPTFSPPSSEIGACVDFHGIVRGMEDGKKIAGLHYEAYLPMASKQVIAGLRELSYRHVFEHVEFIHRTGWVPVGEASLFIRVFAKHRAEALAVCEGVITHLKSEVPVWKSTRGSAE